MTCDVIALLRGARTENSGPLVEAQKNVPGDANCWVRLSRDEPGTIIGY